MQLDDPVLISVRDQRNIEGKYVRDGSVATYSIVEGKGKAQNNWSEWLKR